MPGDRERARLLLIKAVHTIVWAFFVACIAGLYAFAWRREFVPAFALAGVVAIEVFVLVANRMRCPLTAVAARYTDDRAENFDIWLPRWLARHNQAIFGTLYAAGVAWALARWW
jgi:hypothetical protein